MTYHSQLAETIKATIRDYHDYKIEKTDEEINTLLGLLEDEQETKVSRPTLDAQFGLEQFIYEGTPYEYARWFLHMLDPLDDDVVYDLGSGYGRVVLYGAIATSAQFKGIEIVPERVDLSREVKQRLAVPNATFVSAPVRECDFSDGTIFFLFNPFLEKTFRQTLDRLEKLAQTKRIRIVCWGGGRTELIGFQPWLHELSRESDASQPFSHKIKFFESV